MSIKISDLTVSFKNGVTAINHVDLEIPNGIFGLLARKRSRENNIDAGVDNRIKAYQWSRNFRWHDLQ